jgi:hypothetical protein
MEVAAAAAAAGTDADDDDRGELLTEAALFVCDDIILLGTIKRARSRAT